MFTGIVELVGIVKYVAVQGGNRTYWIESGLSNELKVDQSVSHNGVCLTVEEVLNGSHRVTAIDETLAKTTLRHWAVGTAVNIERCLPINGRLDGHMVQGHVDATARCVRVDDRQGSWVYGFEFPVQFAHLVIEKGSICINGISLTAFNVGGNTFSVAIIPYTYQHTDMRHVQPGSAVNIEFDILGKYVARWRQVGAAVLPEGANV